MATGPEALGRVTADETALAARVSRAMAAGPPPTVALGRIRFVPLVRPARILSGCGPVGDQHH